MAYGYLPVIIVGILMLFWGFWNAHEGKKPLNIIGAILAPVGLVVALLGTLLLCVPGFFSEP